MYEPSEHEPENTTINRLMDEMTTLMLADFDAETRFKLRSTRGADRAQEGFFLPERTAQERPETTR